MTTSWRYLSDDGAGAAAGLATDEAILTGYRREASPADQATLRLYTYRPHCALVGRYQNVADEVDLAACAREGVEVSRRPTGGGAILMGPGQLGVAVATRATDEARPKALLQRFAAGVIRGLAELGIAPAFRAKNDLEVGGRKLAGLGLCRDPHGALLFHASVLVDLDVALMLRVLRIPAIKLADKAAATVAERVTTLSRELDRELDAAAVRATFHGGFADAFGATLRPGELSRDERRRRDELIATRYGDHAWVHQARRQRQACGSALLKTPAGLLRFHVATQGEVVQSLLISGDLNELPPGLLRLEAALRWGAADRGRVGAAAVGSEP